MSGGALGAVADIGGNLLTSAANYQYNKKLQIRATEANREESERERAFQREMAQNGIKWRMEDAAAAGVHPLAALGVQPISGGGGGGAIASPGSVDFSSVGQAIGRAAYATADDKERAGMMADLSLENASLKNDLLRAQIATYNQPATGPGIPSNSGLGSHLLEGQSSSRTSPGFGYVEERPLQKTHSAAGRPGQEVGYIDDYAFVRTPSGMAVVPSNDVKQRIEDQIIQEGLWSWRNNIAPFFKGLPKPSLKDYPLPKGYDWEWKWWRQEFQPVKKYHGVEGRW